MYMTHDRLFARLYRPILASAALIIIFWALGRIAYVASPLLLAFFITIIAAPYLSRLEHRGLSHRLSLLVVIALVCVVFLAFVLTVAFSLADLIGTLPTYGDSFQSTIDAAVKGLASQGLDLSRAAAEPATQASSLIGSFMSLLEGLLSTIGSALLILLVFVLFLLDAKRIPGIVQQRFPDNPVLATFGRYGHDVRSYFANLAIVNIVIAGLSTVLLLSLRVPNAFMWGVAILILHFVPVLGLWLALIPLTFTALVVNGPTTALIAFVGVVLIDGITSNTLYYRLLGAGLNLSPAAMFVSVLFWIFILGPLGALLALPLTMLVKMMILDDDAKMASEIISYQHSATGRSPPRKE
jgi:AI-2 transport protein TqsA